MTQVGVAKLKASLSEYLTMVKAGESVIVTEHGRPIAELGPISPALEDDRAYLEALAREGLVRLGSGTLPDEFFDLVGPDDPGGTALASLLEERENGR